jgi:hypothetical protein
MQLSEIFTELENLLESCGLDEAWSDWLRDFDEKTRHACNDQQRLVLLTHLEESEAMYLQLDPYLPAITSNGVLPHQKLSSLISALDWTVRQELCH